MATSSPITAAVVSTTPGVVPTSTPGIIPTTSTPTTTTTIPTPSTVVQAISSTIAHSSATSSSPSNTAAFKTVYVTVTATPKGDQSINGSGLDDGAVVGIAFGGIVLLALIGAIAYHIIRRRRRKAESHVEIPSTTGSRGNLTEEKSSTDALWQSEGYQSEGFVSPSETVYEMEVPAPKAVVRRPELMGRPRDLERGSSLIDSRHIMSRGRPLRRGQGSTRYSANDPALIAK